MKILYVVSDIDKSLEFEWTATSLKSSCQLKFILIGKKGTTLERYLQKEGIPCIVFSDEESSTSIAKFFLVFAEIFRNRPDVVHCHMWRANMFGLLAAWILRIKKRVYTRHHTLTHYREFPKGRKWDLLCNFWATHIVAISNNVRQVLVDLDKAPADKIAVIPHGFGLELFSNVEAQRVMVLREKYKLGGASPVIGVISRYLELKGIQYIIPAFAKLRTEFPQARLLLANAKGHYSNEIKSLLAALPENSYTEILFEEDLMALYQLMNVHVHVPVDPQCEAFGQTYVEALASGVPSVFTLSGVAPEFIRHEYNALVVPFRDSNGIFESVKRVLTENALRETLIANGRKSVSLFSLDKMIHRLVDLYES